MAIVSLLVFAGIPTGCNSNTSPLKNKQHETCQELAVLICAKAATCSESISYRSCVKDLSTVKCDENPRELMNTCISHFANVPCGGSVPESCLQLK